MAATPNEDKGKPPRKRAPKAPAAEGAAPKPRAKRKPAGEGAAKPAAPKKPRAPRKKALDDQLSLGLENVAPVETVKPPRARAKRAAPPAETHAPVAPPPEPKRARPAETRRPAPQAAPVQRPAAPSRVSDAQPRRIRVGDYLPKWPRRTTPRAPMPLLERMLAWVRNAATAMVVLLSLFVMWGAIHGLLNPSSTPLMWVRYWQGLNGDRFVYNWKPYEELGDNTLLAIVAAEDPGFFEASGLNPDTVKDVVTGEEEETLSASTLSQRVARNMFSWPGEGYVARGLEGFFRYVVEISWRKRRTLEVYANVSEFGPGIYGAEAAAQTYFRKSAKQLTTEEAALLAACLRREPGKEPEFRDPGLLARRDAIYYRMDDIGGVQALHEALPDPAGKKK